MTEQNTVERQIDLKAPQSKVWKALTEYQQFNEWFGVNLSSPFKVGETTRGPITEPKECQDFVIEINVQQIEPETLFSYTWHPYAIDPEKDYSQETPTLVVFRLESTATGTRLTVTESGFDKIPADRRAEAFRMHEKGWTIQLQNIEEHVLKA
jgi:uncharacterized protein YndB with AHSA1/START domain